MTTTQQRKVLQRIQTLEADIEAIEKARADVLKSGYASATLTSGGGSKSYTRLDIARMTEAINSMKNELNKLQRLLSRNGQQDIWKQVLVVYS